MFEESIFNQLCEYFKNNDVTHNPIWFSKLHSKEYASLEMVDRILQYLDEGNLPTTLCI